MKMFRYFFICCLLIGCKPQDYNPKYKDLVGRIVLDSTMDKDKEIVDLIAPYKQELDVQMKQVIGFAGEEFNNSSDETKESTLGDFVADLLLEQTQNVAKDTVHLAVINHHGGLRTPIRKGEITVQNIFELMPFENEMWVLNLNGSLVQQLFNNAAKRRSNCIAGATYTIVDDTLAQDIIINGQNFNPNKRYRVSISDYLAGGGGGHSFLSEIAPHFDPDYKCRDMIIDYIKTNSLEKGDTLIPKIDYRVQIAK